MDEAQNATPQQLEMVLTRLGEGSRIYMSGCSQQIALKKPSDSGFVDLISKMQNLEGLAIVNLAKADIVRDPFVIAMSERLHPEML